MAFQTLRTSLATDSKLELISRRPGMISLMSGLMLMHLGSRVLPAARDERPEVEGAISIMLLDLFFLERILARRAKREDILQAGLRVKHGHGCVVCGKRVCICPLRRSDRRGRLAFDPLSEAEAPTSLARWQAHLAALYPNPHLGPNEILARLLAESGELLATIGDWILERNERELSLELADVFAWICALGSKLGVRLDEEDVLNYGPVWRDELLKHLSEE